MAKKKDKKKSKMSTPLLIVGVISGMFATFSLMCIPCIMAAYPAIGLFFAMLGALALLLARYSWIFMVVGVLLIVIGILLQLSQRKTCG